MKIKYKINGCFKLKFKAFSSFLVFFPIFLNIPFCLHLVFLLLSFQIFPRITHCSLGGQSCVCSFFDCRCSFLCTYQIVGWNCSLIYSPFLPSPDSRYLNNSLHFQRLLTIIILGRTKVQIYTHMRELAKQKNTYSKAMSPVHVVAKS